MAGRQKEHVVAQKKPLTPEELARRRAQYLTGLMWHAGAFLIINAFFWILDLWTGAAGINWSFWITALWGFALAFHALAWFVEGRQVEERKTRQYIEEATGPRS